MESAALQSLVSTAAGSGQTTAARPLYGSTAYSYGVIDITVYAIADKTAAEFGLDLSADNSTWYNSVQEFLPITKPGRYLFLASHPLLGYMRLNYTMAGTTVWKADVCYVYGCRYDLENFFFDRELLRWVDSNNDNTLEAEEESAIGESALWASSQLDQLFGGAYATPFATIPEELHQAWIIGCGYRLITRRGFSQTNQRFVQEWDAIMRDFGRAISSGRNILTGVSQFRRIDATSRDGNPIMGFSMKDEDGNQLTATEGQHNYLDNL